MDPVVSQLAEKHPSPSVLPVRSILSTGPIAKLTHKSAPGTGIPMSSTTRISNAEYATSRWGSYTGTLAAARLNKASTINNIPRSIIPILFFSQSY